MTGGFEGPLFHLSERKPASQVTAHPGRLGRRYKAPLGGRELAVAVAIAKICSLAHLRRVERLRLRPLIGVKRARASRTQSGAFGPFAKNQSRRFR